VKLVQKNPVVRSNNPAEYIQMTQSVTRAHE